MGTGAAKKAWVLAKIPSSLLISACLSAAVFGVGVFMSRLLISLAKVALSAAGMLSINWSSLASSDGGVSASICSNFSLFSFAKLASSWLIEVGLAPSISSAVKNPYRLEVVLFGALAIFLFAFSGVAHKSLAWMLLIISDGVAFLALATGGLSEYCTTPLASRHL